MCVGVPGSDHGMLLLRPTAALLLSCRWQGWPLQPRLAVRCRSPPLLAASKGGDDDGLASLVADLNAQLNDWSDFDDAAPPPSPTPGAGVSSKRAASGKSKAAKAYLRRGPKRMVRAPSRHPVTAHARQDAHCSTHGVP